MDPERLARRRPHLYHMAAFGSWPLIAERGLLSTSSLLDLFEIVGDQRRRIESEWRLDSIEIQHPRFGRALVRDQKPLQRPEVLHRRLMDGLTPRDWYEILNRHAFFWLDDARLQTLRNAAAYRDLPQTIITVNTRRLLERHGPSVRLSTLNSGSLLRFGARRGRDTFWPLESFHHGVARIVELCVGGGVPDIIDLAEMAEHEWPGGRREILWQREDAGPVEP